MKVNKSILSFFVVVTMLVGMSSFVVVNGAITLTDVLNDYMKTPEVVKSLKDSEALYAKRPGTLRQMEVLDRATVAVAVKDMGIYIGWRLFGTDAERTAFDIYRNGSKINASPITGATNYTDKDGKVTDTYRIDVILDGVVTEKTDDFKVLENGYMDVKVGAMEGYELNEMAVGDLNGDGHYEFVCLREPIKYGGADYKESKIFPLFQAYTFDGKLMWTIDIGPNIADTEDLNFSVCDYDSDGKAEVAIRTVELTKDGMGNQIGDVDKDGKTDYRDTYVSTGSRQYLVDGPIFISMFDGTTGKEIARADYIERGNLEDWGGKGLAAQVHRASKFEMTPAYLDGVHPSLVIARGCWTLNKLRAFNYSNGKFTKLWDFDSLEHPEYNDQANHQICVADVDFDGKDEIIWGDALYDQDGKALWYGSGHGDAIHIGKFMPDYPHVFEIGKPHENVVADGLAIREARTGIVMASKPNSKDAGRGVISDCLPGVSGPQLWGAGGTGYMYYDDTKGTWNELLPKLPESRRWLNMNYMTWFDGDLYREFGDGTSITKLDIKTGETTFFVDAKEDCFSLNYTKATPSLQADLLGDWREEYVLPLKTQDAFRIFTTTIPTDYRIFTLMHDPLYRLGTMWQNNHYTLPPHVGFYLGQKTTTVPAAEIFVMKDGNKITNPDLKVAKPTSVEYKILKPNPVNVASSSEVGLIVGNASANVNGKTSTLDVPPQIVDGRTMVPVRFIAEAFNSTVDWKAETREVTITTKSGTVVKMVLDSASYTVDGVQKVLDVPAKSINGRTMVPLRAMAEAIGKKLFWNGENQLIVISDKELTLDANGVLEKVKGILGK